MFIFYLKSVQTEQYCIEYFKLFTELLIVYSPAIPHFTSECWEILRDKLPLRGHFNQVK